MIRIFCIGRNYADHAKELGNTTPTKPMIFMKPETSLVRNSETINFPQHGNSLHYETELVLEISKSGKPENKEDVKHFISGFGLGLDLTLRDLQNELKQKGHPWEIAKAFDESATITKIVGYEPEKHNLNNLQLACFVNGEEKQNGNTRDMIFNIETLVLYISSIWNLEIGDLIYTGTPKGVGELHRGDRISVLGDYVSEQGWNII